MRDYMRLDEVARLCGVTISTVINHEREGLLPVAERVGRMRVYSPESARHVVQHFSARRKWQRLRPDEGRVQGEQG